MQDTIRLINNTIRFANDTLHSILVQPSASRHSFWDYLAILLPTAVSLVAAFLVAKNARKQINASYMLFERQTYVDLILRNKNEWKDALMEAAAKIEKEIIAYIKDQSKDTHKAQAIYFISKIRQRLNIHKLSHAEVLTYLREFEGFFTGMGEHNIQSDEELFSRLKGFQEKLYKVCKEVWDEIQAKCKWEELS